MRAPSCWPRLGLSLGARRRPAFALRQRHLHSPHGRCGAGASGRAPPGRATVRYRPVATCEKRIGDRCGFNRIVVLAKYALPLAPFRSPAVHGPSCPRCARARASPLPQLPPTNSISRTDTSYDSHATSQPNSRALPALALRRAATATSGVSGNERRRHRSASLLLRLLLLFVRPPQAVSRAQHAARRLTRTRTRR